MEVPESKTTTRQPAPRLGGGPGEPPQPDPPTPPAKRTRTVSPSPYLIQRRVDPQGDRPGYWDDQAVDGSDEAEEFDDTADALRFIREHRIVGKLRIVSVKRELTTVEEQTTTFKVT